MTAMTSSADSPPARLLAEEIDADREMTGNFPQAFSHIGLVNAAWAITQAQQHATPAAPAALEHRG